MSRPLWSVKSVIKKKKPARGSIIKTEKERKKKTEKIIIMKIKLYNGDDGSDGDG